MSSPDYNSKAEGNIKIQSPAFIGFTTYIKKVKIPEELKKWERDMEEQVGLKVKSIDQSKSPSYSYVYSGKQWHLGDADMESDVTEQQHTEGLRTIPLIFTFKSMKFQAVNVKIPEQLKKWQDIVNESLGIEIRDIRDDTEQGFKKYPYPATYSVSTPEDFDDCDIDR